MKGKANENGKKVLDLKQSVSTGVFIMCRDGAVVFRARGSVAPRATSATAMVKAGVERVVLRLMGTRLILISLPGSSNFTDLVICGQLQKGEIRNDKYLHYLQRLKCHQMVF